MNRPSPSLWPYRLFLRLLPRSFREQYGDEMVRLFHDRQREAGASPRRRARVWAQGAADLITHALAERLPPRRPPIPSPTKGSSPMERWLTDVRHSVRALRATPAFTAAAIGTLALGIGATVAMFTAVHGVLLRPLPYPEPERLVRVWPQNNFNKAMMGRVLTETPALESITGMSGWLFTLTGEGDPQQVYGVMVAHNHFDVLGVRPALGRNFTAEDAVPGQADVVILSHGLWANVFGADPDVIGRRVRLAAGDHQTRRIVGVMPPDFQSLDPGQRLWSPLEVDPSLSVRDDDSWYVNTLIGRLTPGATTEQATEQVRAIAAALHREWPGRWNEEDQHLATVEPLHAYLVRDVEATLWTLMAAVAMILLIACANVANLMLARGTTRAADLAMRSALGATRRRLIGQLLTESAVLSLIGGLAGLLVAAACLRLLALLVPEGLHQLAAVSIDPWVLAFAVAVSLGSVLLFGLVPAWRASAPAVAGSLATAPRGSIGGGRAHVGKALLALEVGLAVVLLAGAGLMLRSLWNLYTDDVGFDTRGALSFRISIPEGRFQPDALRAHYARIWESIEAVPGVERVGGIHLLPLSGGNWSFPYLAEDHPVPDGTPVPSANHRIVTPSYFATLGIPLLAGRGFTEQDTAGAENVGMINRTMARELWGEAEAVGKTITVFGTPFRVVGVIADVRQHDLRRDIAPEMYRPFGQWPIGGMFAIVRTSGDPAALVLSIQHAVWEVDDEAPLAQVRTLSAVFGESFATDRFVSLLTGSFGAVALALAVIGVYGVTAYAVGRRLPEYGLRMAVGADRATVLRQAIFEGVTPALFGVGAGLLAAWWATTLWGASGPLAGQLYGVEPLDAATLVIAPAVLLAIATLACAVPSWRASRLDPVQVLRRD